MRATLASALSLIYGAQDSFFEVERGNGAVKSAYSKPRRYPKTTAGFGPSM